MMTGTASSAIGTAIHVRLANIGRLPLCNLNAGHAPHIGGICLPLCWRCMGIVIGMLIAGAIVHPPNAFADRLSIAGLLSIPCAIDVAAQRWLAVESTSFRRVFTGMLTGAATALI